MTRPTLETVRPAAALLTLLFCTLSGVSSPAAAQAHPDLIQLFDDWRAFERPVFVDGVPDYSADAMSRQYSIVSCTIV